MADIPKLAAPLNPRIIYDRWGKSLDQGDVVHILGRTDVMWVVADIRPVLDPQAPPGTLIVSLQATLQIPVRGGVRLQDVLKQLDARQVAGLQAQQDPPPPVGGAVES